MKTKISIIMPAKNELAGLRQIIPSIQQLYHDAEIIIVDDGSTDDTQAYCREMGIICISHPYSKGNGAAIKTGAKSASGDVLVFMDADGQHNSADIKSLLEQLEKGHDMVVGARDRKSQANILRHIANTFYNRLASWIVGQEIDDLTSGLRAVDATKFKEFLYLLPNGFSYPSTVTMAFFKSGYSVSYMPVFLQKRIGKSHIKPTRDFIRFFLIIFKIGTLYSPLKIFLPLSLLSFSLGILNYFYTYFMYGSFTNMSMLLITTSLLIFLIGLISEQVTMLIYKN
jgi:glycosyltransferase involved in cell wall biosynthesis